MKIFKNILEYLQMYPPECADGKGWRDFNIKCKKEYPIRYWFNETLIPNCWWPITRTFSNIRSWFRFRFLERMHIINTGLKPDYYDTDTLLLHGMFNLLKNFVEIEKAWMQAIFSEDYKKPWYPFKRFRDRDRGIKYLDWEISLKDEKTDSEGEKIGHLAQSVKAQDIKDLYIWWVDKRPKRIDPYELLPDDFPGEDKSLLDFDSPLSDEMTKAYKEIDKIEKEYEEEDTNMLIKLVEVRRSLWT